MKNEQMGLGPKSSSGCTGVLETNGTTTVHACLMSGSPSNLPPKMNDFLSRIPPLALEAQSVDNIMYGMPRAGLVLSSLSNFANMELHLSKWRLQ
eukprot:CAMPEP_0117555600 /NCGR_PEP_ID=MMETSP0784-20121206/51358_1 /TAXON_ID=39447 /ORGANISM="" /LENGTH=94 /DNA_ID=CAMNT_0005352811 /DNA_START=535 /DNA_END=819 /DNA_ORIENTATION=-